MTGFACSCCGAWHDELPFSFHFEAPVHWYGIPEAERERRAALDGELCVIDDEHFFIHAVITLPVLDGPNDFGWGV
jgi:hypothetical protein